MNTRPLLVLSDMDDTLLTTDKHVTPSTIQFLREFIEEGNIFSICSGRPRSGCLPFFEEMALPSMPMVTDNGCAIYNMNGEDRFFEIPLESFRSFLREIESSDYLLYMTTRHSIAYAHHLDRVPFWLRHDKEAIDLKSLIDVPVAPLICNLHVYQDAIGKVEQALKKYPEDIFYVNWGLHDGVYHLELHSPKASKGHALQILKEFYHIDDDRTAAFGDAMNDLSMIEAAHFGVAMINAGDELKEKADLITEYDHNHDGVIHAIQKLL